MSARAHRADNHVRAVLGHPGHHGGDEQAQVGHPHEIVRFLDALLERVLMHICISAYTYYDIYDIIKNILYIICYTIFNLIDIPPASCSHPSHPSLSSLTDGDVCIYGIYGLNKKTKFPDVPERPRTSPRNFTVNSF